LGAKGNPGVAGLVKQLPGSIGYVELVYALQNNMPVGLINDLKRELTIFATLVEHMIEKSIKGFLDKKRELLLEVLENDEPKANSLELVLDELCTTLIAQFEPKAKGLRTILMIAKMSNDLERMGDHVVNIAESSVKPLPDLPKMAELTIKMLKDSTISFINEDTILARNVCERDGMVDELKDRILQELIDLMRSDTSTIERSLHLIRISGNLERIADLSTNICEEVIFVAKGKVIKHHRLNGKGEEKSE
jgi:phosphate transport system protein